MMKVSEDTALQLKISDFEDKSLLIVDDDDPLRGRLSRAMEKKGFLVKEAKSKEEALDLVKKSISYFDLRHFIFLIKCLPIKPSCPEINIFKGS